jgi:hypothetical protein
MSDYKKKRQEAMSSGFKRVYGPSMGARVDSTPCSMCGRTTAHTHKTGAVIENGQVFYDPLDYSGVQLIAFSSVPAPCCETCDEPMKYTQSGTNWSCQNGGCKQQGVSVTTGVGGVVGSVE